MCFQAIADFVNQSTTQSNQPKERLVEILILGVRDTDLN